MSLLNNGLKGNEDFKLNQQQQKVYDWVAEGKNVFCSGVGGTGKSYLISKLKKDFGYKALFLSTTGISAVNIGGQTFNSGLSIPIGHPTKRELDVVSKKVDKILSNNVIKMIVIDEASMLTPGGVYAFRQRLRKYNKLGIQVVLFCDMGQIGSIMNRKEKELANQYFKTDKFYKMRQFNDFNFKFVELTEVIRQGDLELKEMLGYIREARGTYETRGGKEIFTLGDDALKAINYFNTHCFKGDMPKDTVILTTTNKSAAYYNKLAFDKNPNQCYEYTAEVVGPFIEKDCPAECLLKVKEGIKVMILKNGMDSGYVNGSTGTVSGIYEDSVYVKLDPHGKEVSLLSEQWDRKEYGMLTNEDGDDELTQYTVATFEQIPIKQCDAISIHKSQGQTLDNFILDLGNHAGWATGLVYVGLSRATSRDSIHLKRKIRPSDVVADREALDWLEGMLERDREE